MQIIILHNSEDAHSIHLVKTLPQNDGNTYIVVDWYKVHSSHNGKPCDCIAGGPYEGPDPSAFPELVFFDKSPPVVNSTGLDGKPTSFQSEPGWVRIRAATAISDIQDRTKFDARKPDPVDSQKSNKVEFR